MRICPARTPNSTRASRRPDNEVRNSNSPSDSGRHIGMPTGQPSCTFSKSVPILCLSSRARADSHSRTGSRPVSERQKINASLGSTIRDRTVNGTWAQGSASRVRTAARENHHFAVRRLVDGGHTAGKRLNSGGFRAPRGRDLREGLPGGEQFRSASLSSARPSHTNRSRRGLCRPCARPSEPSWRPTGRRSGR